MYPAKYCNETTIKSDKTFPVYKYRSSNALNNLWSLGVYKEKSGTEVGVLNGSEAG